MDLKRFKHSFNSQEITNGRENRPIFQTKILLAFSTKRQSLEDLSRIQLVFVGRGKLSRICLLELKNLAHLSVIQEVPFVST